MQINISGKFVALIGLHAVAVLEMPRFWSNIGFFAGNKSGIICR